MKLLKLLVYGEGPTDYGWPSAAGEWKPGPIIFLIQKCAEEFHMELEIHYASKKLIEGKDALRPGMRRLRGLDGKGIPAAKFAFYALNQKEMAGIFYCDTDKIAEGKNTRETDCRKHFAKIHAEVEEGFAKGGDGRWRGVPMIALKMVECWLMADGEAYRKCFGKLPERCPLPDFPELIWGEKSDRNSNYPKHCLRRILEQYNAATDRDTFIRIAEHTGLPALKERGCRLIPIFSP